LLQHYCSRRDTAMTEDRTPSPPPSNRLAADIALLANCLPECLWLVDVAERRVVYANPAYERLWQRPRAMLMQDRFDWLTRILPEDRSRVQAALFRHPMGGLDLHFRILSNDAAIRWIHLKSFAIGEGHRPHTVGGIAFDVTDMLAGETRSELWNRFDELTGLASRRQFHEQLEEALRHARRHERQCALLCLGLNGFQHINDDLGYRTGDRLLALLSERLHHHLRAGDRLGRLAPTAFAILQQDPGSSEELNQAAHRLLASVTAPMHIEGREVTLSASVGIALFPGDGESADPLLYRAEMALGKAQRCGSGQVHFSQDLTNARLQHKALLDYALERALAEKQFQVFFQPKVSCRNGAIAGAEALVRWQHPQRGLVGPDEFIPAMEENGQIVTLGAWVLRESCRQAARWYAMGQGSLSVAVNLSARQLHETDLVRLVEQTLAETGLPPHWLELELTETMLMEDVESTIRTLTDLGAMGVRLSVDDFGTGYSSLSYLKRFPLDVVKVDRSLIRDIVDNTHDISITRAIITMAHALEMKVVAEGVESESQLALLVANQCDLIQGFYFSRPVPAEEMVEMLEAGKAIPDDLIHPRQRQRTLLLVDDEENILSALKRLLRKEGYHILTANGGEAGLELLANQAVDVIISDQRMPGMTGVEFLRRAKVLYPQTIRIVLSGYTELQAVTSAINEGAIYKFLTKPWDDDQLRAQIAEAFMQKELADDNRRLGEVVQQAKTELEAANQELQRLLQEREQRISRDETALGVLHEVMEIVPWPFLGVDEEGAVVMANGHAEKLFRDQGGLLGQPLDAVLPPPAAAALLTSREPIGLQLCGRTYTARSRVIGLTSAGRGLAITLVEENTQ